MIKTKHEIVKQDIGLWAIPKSPECMEPGEFPFSFELYGTTTHWRDSAIFVCTAEVEVDVPEAIDLLAMAHQTLDQRAAKALADYQKQLDEIEKYRKKLYLLDAPVQPPKPDNVVPLYDGADFIPAEGA